MAERETCEKPADNLVSLSLLRSRVGAETIENLDTSFQNIVFLSPLRDLGVKLADSTYASRYFLSLRRLLNAASKCMRPACSRRLL